VGRGPRGGRGPELRHGNHNAFPHDVGVYVEAQTSSGDVNASGSRLDGDACVNAAYEESDMTFSTDLIGAQELKEKLDRGDDFELVMVMGEREYRAKRIPGSLLVTTVKEALEALAYEDDLVLYDTGPPCTASRMACRILKARGYRRVRRYSGGLEEWESMGYPLEGEHVG
jgi:rhodanese-related sulfurtransferase